MSARIRVAIFASLATYGFPIGAWAQSVTPGELESAARQGEQLLRQQQQILEEQQRERDRERQQPAGKELPTAPPAAPAAVPEDGKCVDVQSLDVVGIRHISKKQVSRLQRDVTGHCIGTTEINALLRRITDIYVSKGYVTSRAYIPPQNMKEGRLTIVVIEGTVERIEVEPKGSVSTVTAFPDMTGRVFNLRDAEQGIDQLNRLSTNNAKLDIRPGSTPGSSELVVMNSPSRRVTGSLSVDDTGTDATGLWQGTATLVADNPLKINDNLLISHSRSIDDPAGPAMSRATAVNYSVPYGWWTGSLMYSESAYATVVPGITRNFVTSGTSRNETVRLDRVGYRDQSRKLTFYADITRRDTENFVANQLIGASSRVLTLLDLSSNLSINSGGALWSFDAGISRGVTWLGGLHDAGDLPGNVPHGEFLKMIAGAGVVRNFAPFGVRTRVSSTFAGQWSNDALYPSEQVAIAGPFAVRGYRDVRLFGDRGFTWRNELGFPFAFGVGNAPPIGVRPFIGTDFGKVWAHNDVPSAYLSGVAAGVNLAFASVSLQLSWSGAAWRSNSVPYDHLFFARLAASF
jgi:hemolysin activation/secretion protein